MNVLVLNAGSSSLKFQVIATDLEKIKEFKDDRICRGEIEGIGGSATIQIRYREQAARKFTSSLPDLSSALHYLLRFLTTNESGVQEIRTPADVHAVGHRVVHGGERFSASVL